MLTPFRRKHWQYVLRISKISHFSTLKLNSHSQLLDQDAFGGMAGAGMAAGIFGGIPGAGGIFGGPMLGIPGQQGGVRR